MKKTLLATVALVGLAAPAMAADLPVKYRPPPPPPVYFSWTGCYIGGNVGGVWVEKEITGPLGGTLTGDASSGAVGLQAGCNYQFAGGWVIGIQGDYDWINAGFERNSVFFDATTSLRAKSVASLTGRIGYAWDRFLGYVKFGGAWERDELTLNFFNGFVATASDTRSGWTIGIGAEYAFTNWVTARALHDQLPLRRVRLLRLWQPLAQLRLRSSGLLASDRRQRNKERLQGRSQFPV